MKYTVKDFLGELASNYGVPFIKQELSSNLQDYQGVSRESFWLHPSTERLMPFLDLNDFVRVEKDTYFKVHKGYPSPRSLYPVKLFLSAGDSCFLSKHDLKGSIECYRNDRFNAAVGDLVLEFDHKYPEYYRHIKKTLLLLEIGHFLYNILFLAKEMGITYRLNPSLNRIHLEKVLDEERTVDQRVLAAFKEKYTTRNSGPYLYPMTKTKVKPLLEIDDFNALVEAEISEMNHFFISGRELGLETLTYFNTGEGRFIPTVRTSHASEISYQQMNTLYPYVNFYGVSFFTFFLLPHSKVEEFELTERLLALGYLAQSICLNYSDSDQFCRPIKSFNIDQVELLFDMDSSRFTPFYFLLSGSK